MLTLADIPPTILLKDLVTPPDNRNTASVLEQYAHEYVWFVAETRTRQEKTLARYLTEHKQPYFLPFAIHKSPSNNRVFEPLLPGFVFVAAQNPDLLPDIPDPIDRLNWLRALVAPAKEICRTSRSIWGFIDASDQPQLRKDLIALANPMTFIEPSSVRGAKVKVIAGPLEGMAGTVVHVDDHQTRVLFDMKVLNQPYSTMIDTSFLKPVE